MTEFLNPSKDAAHTLTSQAICSDKNLSRATNDTTGSDTHPDDCSGTRSNDCVMDNKSFENNNTVKPVYTVENLFTSEDRVKLQPILQSSMDSVEIDKSWIKVLQNKNSNENKIHIMTYNAVKNAVKEWTNVLRKETLEDLVSKCNNNDSSNGNMHGFSPVFLDESKHEDFVVKELLGKILFMNDTKKNDDTKMKEEIVRQVFHAAVYRHNTGKDEYDNLSHHFKYRDFLAYSNKILMDNLMLTSEIVNYTSSKFVGPDDQNLVEVKRILRTAEIGNTEDLMQKNKEAWLKFPKTLSGCANFWDHQIFSSPQNKKSDMLLRVVKFSEGVDPLNPFMQEFAIWDVMDFCEDHEKKLVSAWKDDVRALLQYCNIGSSNPNPNMSTFDYINLFHRITQAYPKLVHALRAYVAHILDNSANDTYRSTTSAAKISDEIALQQSRNASYWSFFMTNDDFLVSNTRIDTQRFFNLLDTLVRNYETQKICAGHPE